MYTHQDGFGLVVLFKEKKIQLTRLKNKVKEVLDFDGGHLKQHSVTHLERVE